MKNNVISIFRFMPLQKKIFVRIKNCKGRKKILINSRKKMFSSLQVRIKFQANNDKINLYLNEYTISTTKDYFSTFSLFYEALLSCFCFPFFFCCLFWCIRAVFSLVCIGRLSAVFFLWNKWQPSACGTPLFYVFSVDKQRQIKRKIIITHFTFTIFYHPFCFPT